MIHSGRKAALFMIQDQLSRGHRITVILRALRIPSSTYYDWLKWHPKSRNRRRIKLKELVQVLWQRRKFYGYVRIAKRIRKLLKCRLSDRTIWKVMRELGIQSTMYRKRSKKPTTTTDMPQKPNLMRHLADLSEVVTTDITYIQLINQKWVYLATAYDPKARKVLAWQVGQQMTQDLAVAPIQALIHQGYTFKMVHSDMGSQYTSRLFETTLTDAHLRHSYSRKGKPTDNGRIEAYHSLLKREWVRLEQINYESILDVTESIARYNTFYNHDRETNGRGACKRKSAAA
ncbi:IS3 family transposase [Lacticaseibacillus paracasei]|nr:IS3 family transposase [Lacticaseibacillus paracasei]